MKAKITAVSQIASPSLVLLRGRRRHLIIFELVATAKNGTLTVYIDRLLTNETGDERRPFDRNADRQCCRVAGKDGTYLAPAPWSAREGK